MWFRSLFDALLVRSSRTPARQGRPASKVRQRPRFVLPYLEILEDRSVPSTLTVTSAADSGAGSLRGEIAAAQSGDTINFAPSLAGQTISLTSGELAINKSLNIEGPGGNQLTVAGLTFYSPYSSFSIFTVGSAANVQISGLTITNASGTVIHNEGSIIINNSTLTSGDYTSAGALYNIGSATINNSILAHNFASVTVFNLGTLIVSNSTVSDNNARGIDNYGNLTVSNSTLSGNNGSAIDNYGYATVNNSTLSGNRAVGGAAYTSTTWDGPYGPNSYYYPAGNGIGGGIYMGGGTLTINSSTLTNNQAIGGPDNYYGQAGSGYGGGLYIAGGVVSINNSTLADNRAIGGAGYSPGLGYGGGIYNAAGPDALRMHNTLLADNSGDVGADLNGSFISLGHNLIGDSMGGNGFAASDLLNVNPQLGPLQNNGGPTPTMALLAGSPAINAGDNTGAPAYDQRGSGFPRIVVGILDIGAFEVQNDSPALPSILAVSGLPLVTTAGVAATFTVTAKNADGSINTGYTGTVRFTSSDGQAVLPGLYTFTPADQGVHTFTATLKTAGMQSIAVTDIAFPNLTGNEAGITVNPAAASRFVVAAPSSVRAGKTFSLTVTVTDAYGNVVAGYSGKIHFSSTDTRATLPANYTFMAADQGVHTFTGLVLRRRGNQKITITDTRNPSLNGSVTENVQ